MKSVLNMVRKNPVITAFSIVILLLLATVIIDIIRFGKLNEDMFALSSRIETLESNFSSTTEELRGNITATKENLATELEKNVDKLSDKISDYRNEVDDVTDTIDDLQKLSKTDPELLAKYSKVFFLNENYAPARLEEISNQYKYSDTKILKLIPEVIPHLEEMIDDAKSAKVEMYAFSAFRSFNEQQALKGQYTTIYGAGSANQFSADQGYSEHQLGTTVDIIAPGQGGVLDGFDKTPAYTWLKNNAYKYGFILSYPENNSFYVYEPWHWRFVGVKLATYLHKQNKTFYSMDQRDIDEYLINLFD